MYDGGGKKNLNLLILEVLKDYSDEEHAENERLADTDQADVQAEALDTEADEIEAAGTENDAAALEADASDIDETDDAADSGDEQ